MRALVPLALAALISIPPVEASGPIAPEGGGAPAAEEAKPTPPRTPWSFALYGGRSILSPLLEILTFQNAQFVPFDIVVFSAAREWVRSGDWVAFQTEAHLGHHLEQLGLIELNWIFLLRILPFPWDRWVDTSFAIGSGLSWTAGIPGVEAPPYQPHSSRVLHAIMFELSFGLPSLPRWALLVRLHHRSGVLGLFDNVWGGSDYLCGGLRFHL